jgi:hypothetical protein
VTTLGPAASTKTLLARCSPARVLSLFSWKA